MGKRLEGASTVVFASKIVQVVYGGDMEGCDTYRYPCSYRPCAPERKSVFLFLSYSY